MSKFAILIPMKPIVQSKSRLKKYLDVKSCNILVVSLLRRVIQASIESNADEVHVVGGDQAIKKICDELEIGWMDFNNNLNTDLLSAIRMIEKRRLCAIYVPGDVPFVEPNDINAVIDASNDGKNVVIVPSDGDGGTNCLLFPLRTQFRSLLGENSFQKHCDFMDSIGIFYATLKLNGLSMDIDTKNDFFECNINEPGFTDRLGTQLK